MSEPKCLSEQELSEFVQGRISAERVEQIAEHLEACDDCQSTVVMLGEQSDTFIEQLQSPAAPDALEAEDACQAAVERLAARAAEGRSGPTATLPSLGQTEQLGPYRIRGKLGVGGMGTVFEAEHTKLKRTVALKLLPATRWANPAAVARFEREMEVIGQLDHPNIVRASDANEENGMHYLVMEHVDGLDLSRIANRVGPLAVADACEIGRQAAIALQYAHENHLVHRDIKPSNLMLAGSGQGSTVSDQQGQGRATVKILDMGLALLGESHAAHENELTTVGQLMGTLDYMSPEQGMDSHDVDVRADIYSLGATLYKLLTGRAPFAAPQYDTLLKKVTALANKPARPIKQLRADIPDELAATIDRMLSKQPEERFNTPAEVAAALERFAGDADLGGLLSTALEANEPAADVLPPVIPSRKASVLPSKQPAPLRSPRRRWPGWGLTVGLSFLFLFVFAAGLVIRIATDKGEIIVRAEDEAQVLIRKDGNTVRQLEVAKGDHAVTVRSGAYRIELKGKSDELMVTRDSVSIKRGERVIVHVQQRPKGNSDDDMMSMRVGAATTSAGSGGDEMMRSSATGPMAMGGAASEMRAAMSSSLGGPGRPSKAEPTYDGKTYRQWLTELDVERKPELLTDAVLAFAALGDDDEELAAESAAAVLRVMRRNGQRVIDKSPRGQLIEKSREALAQMPADVVVNSLAHEIEHGSTRSRMFVNHLLGHLHTQSPGMAELSAAWGRQEERLNKLLIQLPEDELPVVRSTALSFVISRARKNDVPLQDIKGLVPALREALKSKDEELLATSALNLVDVDPDNPLLVPALTRLLTTRHLHTSIVLLGKLGPRAAPAVDSLLRIIKPLADNPQQGGGGGFGGGAMGSGMGGFGGGTLDAGMMMGFGGDTYKMVIETLGKIGPAAKKALPALRKIAGPDSVAAVPGGAVTPGAALPQAVSHYAAVARDAIAKIEGKKPLDEEGDPETGKFGSGGFF